MRLELLSHGSPDCPLIRPFDFTPAEAEKIHSVVADLAAWVVWRLAIHQLDFITTVGGLELTFCLRSGDQGISKIGPAAFECCFTSGAWDNVAGLIEPFAARTGGFSWLARGPGEAALVQ